MKQIILAGYLTPMRAADMMKELTGCAQKTENLITLEANHDQYAWFVAMRDDRLLAGSRTGTSDIYLPNLQHMQLISPPPEHDKVTFEIPKRSDFYAISATVTSDSTWYQKVRYYLG